jgi:hypoxanthine phosphoribosyltransferase
MRTLYSKQQIQQRVQELAKQLVADYDHQPLLLVSILRGSFIVAADLMRALYEQGMTTVDIEFMQVSSYGTSHVSSKEPRVISDLQKNIAGKHVLVVEDIIDTGYTLQFVKTYLANKNPSSVKLLAFLDKKEKREVEVVVEYVGFTLKGSPWVEGYGLDGGEFGRARPDIAQKTS